jgi:DHA2 family multidrug resistance protein
MTLFLQLHLEYTPLQAAWMLMPSAIVIDLLSVLAGRLADLVSTKALVIFGLAGVALCLFQHTTINTTTSIGMITFWFTVRGVARAFTIAPLSTASMATLPEAEVRMGSGLLSLNRGIASTGSVALVATLLQNRLATRLDLLAQDQSSMPFGSEEVLHSLYLSFEQLGDFSQVAEGKALAMLQQLFTMEAALHSYHDLFVIIGVLAAVGILPAFWMGKRH